MFLDLMNSRIDKIRLLVLWSCSEVFKNRNDYSRICVLVAIPTAALHQRDLYHSPKREINVSSI
jgi:hypothetical protein